MDGWSKGSVAAALFGIWATFALDVFSTMNSSPQTTELFAGERQDSLMHWVHFGDVVALSGGLAASVASRKAWPVIGAATVVVLMHCSYRHALERGREQIQPGGVDEGVASWTA